MPTKPPFDPSKHLIAASSDPRGREPAMDDEALARMIQEQIIEEERQSSSGGSVGVGGYHNNFQNNYQDNYANRSTGKSYGNDSGQYRENQQGGGNSQQMEEMQLLMMIQREEMEAMQQAHIRQQQQSRSSSQSDDMELARAMQEAEISDQVESGYKNQLDYARMVQEQAFAKVDRTQRGSQDQHSQQSNRSSSHDSDLELAMKMQELEQMGMGSLNSTRNVMAPSSTSNGPARHISRDFLHNESVGGLRSRQDMEFEDARFARMLAEEGERTPFVTPISQAPLRRSPPPRPINSTHHATVPSSLAPVPIPNSKSLSPPPSKSRSPPKSKPHSSMSPTRNQNIDSRAVFMDPLGLSIGDSNKDKERKRGFFSRGLKPSKPVPVPLSIPAPIPPPHGRTGPLPFSNLATERLLVPMAPDAQIQKKKMMMMGKKKDVAICTTCNKPVGSFLIALEKKYHAECFKCLGCHAPINANGPFAYMTDHGGDKHPLHRSCYAELYGVKCAVCKKAIPAGPDGKVSFVKHPFFETEQMCPRHASTPGRRCTGCHRFEPEGEPFADLSDSGRCVCYSCCRSVVVDSTEATPLWNKVLSFLETKLCLPIWKDLREVPILIVGYDALNQMMANGGNHNGSTQIMTRGLCLTEHQSGRQLKVQSLKFNRKNDSFECCDAEEKGFTFIQVPDASKVNPDASVTAILCLSGLPRDLTASVLAHEATHAWIKLHPRFEIGYPIPPQVEEGCAQLIAMLFLTEGLDPASTETYGDSGPSDEKLRQYFKFSIETDDHEIYGEGYRRAAVAYANIGIEALLSHVVLYKDFPKT